MFPIEVVLGIAPQFLDPFTFKAFIPCLEPEELLDMEVSVILHITHNFGCVTTNFTTVHI